MKARKIRKKVRKIAKKGKKLLKKAMSDPLVKEYVEKQKKLAKTTLKKAIRRVEKKIK